MKKLTFPVLFAMFIFCSIFGSIFEGIILILQGSNFELRHDLIYGPFSTLYGFGALIYLLLLAPKNFNIIKTFIYSFFLGGILEYGASFLSEKIFEIKFWDYSNMFLNINGRTTILIMLVWGLMGTILVKVLTPLLINLINKVPPKIRKTFFITFLIFISLDILISYTAFFRMVERNRNIPSKTFIGDIYDRIYNDEFMYQKFPILKEKI